MKLVARLGLFGVIALLAGCATQNSMQQPVGVSTSSTDGGNTTLAIGDPSQDQISEQQLSRIAHALEMVQAGQAQQAIDGPLTEIISYYENKYADQDIVVYSARDTERSLLYLTMAAAASEKAGAPAKNAIVIGPAWAMAHWAKGFAYNAIGQYMQARGELIKALQLAPMNSQYTSELAYTWLKAKDWNKALGLYRNAADNAELVPSPGNVRPKCVALRGQGYALVELHRLDEATKAYQDCLKINPDDPKSKGELRYISRQREKKNMP